jgi:GNAT superfamily N-acetyltransferase
VDATIRSASEEEIATLLSMYEWLFGEPGNRPPRWDHARAGSALREAILGETSAVLVADDEGALIGFCSAYLDLNSVRYGLRCWVGDIAVHPAKRSAGVGKALLDAAKDWARGRGATHLELNTSLARSDAQRFYEREQPDMTGYCYSWALQ